jgi:hypothetical protein
MFTGSCVHDNEHVESTEKWGHFQRPNFICFLMNISASWGWLTFLIISFVLPITALVCGNYNSTFYV